MALLKFPPTDSIKGFTSHETSSFNDVQPAKIVRELIQNSLDAAVEAHQPKAIMRFRKDPIESMDIPGIAEYGKAFDRAVEFWTGRGNGKLTDPVQEVVGRIRESLQSLEEGNANLLSVIDNGIGLDGTRMSSLLSDGASEKQNALSGSYGVGHLAPMALSEIRYMLYGGINKNGHRIVSGRAILATHPGKKKLLSADGYLVKRFRNGLDGNLYDFLTKTSQPILVTKHLDEIGSEWGHGSVVMIPAFNNFRSDMPFWDIVSKVAAYNFCSAVLREKLVIEVYDGDDKKVLDGISLESILEADQTRTRAARSDSIFKGLRPSGQNAYSILKTLAREGGPLVHTEIGIANISLSLSSPVAHPRIDLFRNGMWITDEIPGLSRVDFADQQPFHAVIEIEGKDESKLHRLVRKAEGPMHDQLSLSLLSESERKALDAAIQSIRNWLKDRVPAVGIDEYTVDDFLLVNSDPGGNAGHESFSYWGTPTPVGRRRSNQLTSGIDTTEVDPPDPLPDPDPPDPSDPSGPPKPPKPPRPRQHRRANSLPFRSAIVPEGNGKIRASIATDSDFPEAWLTLRIDENTDYTCDRIWQDEDVEIKSLGILPSDDPNSTPKCEVMSDGRTVKLSEISQNTEYDLKIEYALPAELTEIVGNPVFRLELYRPRNPRKAAAPAATEESQNADGN